jgi:hypothetical protein
MNALIPNKLLKYGKLASMSHLAREEKMVIS